jgi:hypothetical protein
MSNHRCIAWFDSEDSILEAVFAARRIGYTVDDVYTPYAVHGMDEAMGLTPTRLRWVCLGGGLLGLLFGFLFQSWTSAIDWPLNIGGKPQLAAPSFVPVSFELMTLFAALGTVAALLVRARLHPFRKPRFLSRVTDDRFALSLVSTGGATEEIEKQAFCARMGAVEVHFVEVEA